MTSQERQVWWTSFSSRLAKLESSPRDMGGTRRAPDAVYALVQVVLVRDETLREKDTHVKRTK
jgi:uncharacterized protein